MITASSWHDNVCRIIPWPDSNQQFSPALFVKCTTICEWYFSVESPQIDRSTIECKLCMSMYQSSGTVWFDVCRKYSRCFHHRVPCFPNYSHTVSLTACHRPYHHHHHHCHHACHRLRRSLLFVFNAKRWRRRRRHQNSRQRLSTKAPRQHKYNTCWRLPQHPSLRLFRHAE